jgi:hypothetical protein
MSAAPCQLCTTGALYCVHNPRPDGDVTAPTPEQERIWQLQDRVKELETRIGATVKYLSVLKEHPWGDWLVPALQMLEDHGAAESMERVP